MQLPPQELADPIVVLVFPPSLSLGESHEYIASYSSANCLFCNQKLCARVNVQIPGTGICIDCISEQQLNCQGLDEQMPFS
eukprot:1769287-Amphidinium_carterae.1